MSLESVNQQIGRLRDQAESVKQRARNDENTIQRAEHLSQIGKDAELAPVREGARAQLMQMQEREKAIIAEEIVALERRVYGTVGSSPDAVISFRDAQERAERIESAVDGLRAMQRAVTSRDEGLAQAILGRALESGWSEVIDEYATNNPGVAKAVSDLASLRGRQNDIRDVITQAMAYGV